MENALIRSGWSAARLIFIGQDPTDAASDCHRNGDTAAAASGLVAADAFVACVWRGRPIGPPRRLFSELETRSELHSAEIVGGGGYSTERVVSQTDVGKCEALQVGDIEHFGADLKLHAFPNAELLGE